MVTSICYEVAQFVMKISSYDINHTIACVWSIQYGLNNRVYIDNLTLNVIIQAWKDPIEFMMRVCTSTWEFLLKNLKNGFYANKNDLNQKRACSNSDKCSILKTSEITHARHFLDSNFHIFILAQNRATDRNLVSQTGKPISIYNIQIQNCHKNRKGFFFLKLYS